jgi:hypothetical protein
MLQNKNNNIKKEEEERFLYIRGKGEILILS